MNHLIIPAQKITFYDNLLIIIILCLVSSSIDAQIYEPVKNYGGRNQLKEFVNEQLVYPETELVQKRSGTVVIGFMVNSDGSIDNPMVETSISTAIDHEAMRIFKLILWEPALSQNRPIVEKATFSIKFDARKYHKLTKNRGYASLPSPIQPVDTSLKIYKFNELDQQPEAILENKNNSLGSFIYSNLKYPEAAIHQNISGKVKLSFIIETSGLISNVRVDKSIGAGCNEEAIRVLKLIKWKPGLKNLMAVRSSMTIEITFNLKEMENLKYVNPNQNNTF